MNTSVTIAKQAVHDKLESQIKLAEAKLHTLKVAGGEREGERRDQSDRRPVPKETINPAQTAGPEEVRW